MKEAIKNFLNKLDLVRTLTAFTVMGVFITITNALIYRSIPETNKDILIHLLGIVEGAVMTVVTFEFGSSKGSQKKDELLKQSDPNQ